MTAKKGSVPLFPGLADPDCVEAANKAAERMHEAKASCYRLLMSLFSTEHGALEPDAENIAPFFLDDQEVAEDWIEEAKASFDEHREAYQVFSNAMAGRKP